MAAVSQSLSLALSVIVVLSLGLGAMLWLIERKRRRARQLRQDISEGRSVSQRPTSGPDAPISDVAHNRIRIARSGADFLEREGVDVSGVRSMIGRAEERLAQRDPVEAQRIADGANSFLHKLRAERLSTARSAKPAASGPIVTTAGVDPLVGVMPMGSLEDDSVPEQPAARPARNQMESHFQIELLSSELGRARGSSSPPVGLSEAEQLFGHAGEAYGKKEYTEALRLALRGRRSLGERVEVVPPPAASPSFAASAKNRVPEDPPVKCPSCGRMSPASDRFCRGCGRPLSGGACERCGGPLTTGDQYCGRCGAPVLSTAAGPG